MQWLEFERLALHRNALSPSQQTRFDQLSQRDEEIGEHLAKWLVVGIFASWATLLMLAGLFGALSR